MKQRLVLSGLGALGLLGGGALYTIAHVTEQQFTRTDIPLETQQYERGILSATAQQQLVLPPNKLALPRQFQLQHHIQHSLLLTPTRIETRFISQDDANGSSDKPWLNAKTTVNNDGSAAGSFDLSARQQAHGLTWEAAQGRWQWRDGQADINASLPAIGWQTGQQRWQLKQVTLEGQGQLPRHSEGRVDFKGLREFIGDIEALSFQHGSLKWHSRQQHNFADITFTLDIKQLSIVGQAYQNAELNLHLKRIDIPAWQRLLNGLQAVLDTDPAMRWVAALSLLQPLQGVLRSLPEITLDKLILHDENGTALDSRLVVSALAKDKPLTLLNLAQFVDASAQTKLAEPLLESVASWVNLHSADVQPNAAHLLQQWRPLLQQYAQQHDNQYTIAFRLQQGQWALNPVAEDF
jgi:uncharacterized protein YdgA (DUF945 family)